MDIFELNGEKIREFRESLNWTREFLSEKSEVPHGTIKQIETGATKNPGISTMVTLLKAMAPYIPEIGPKDDTKAELFFSAVSALSTMDEDQLGITLSFINDLIANSTPAVASKIAR